VNPFFSSWRADDSVSSPRRSIFGTEKCINKAFLLSLNIPTSHGIASPKSALGCAPLFDHPTGEPHNANPSQSGVPLLVALPLLAATLSRFMFILSVIPRFGVNIALFETIKFREVHQATFFFASSGCILYGQFFWALTPRRSFSNSLRAVDVCRRDDKLVRLCSRLSKVFSVNFRWKLRESCMSQRAEMKTLVQTECVTYAKLNPWRSCSFPVSNQVLFLAYSREVSSLDRDLNLSGLVSSRELSLTN
jgi:hypothetical protein